MRRIVRPRGKLAARLQAQLPAGESFHLETVVSKISSGELLPAAEDHAARVAVG
jgi:hypothetical protein